MKPKKSSLLWQLFRSYFGLVIVTILIVVSVVLKLVHDNAIELAQNNLTTKSVLIEELLSVRIPGLSESELELYIKSLSEETQTRITLIARNGSVYMDSNEHVLSMDNHLSRPEIKDAFSLGKGVSIRYSDTLKETMVYYAFRFSVSENFDGVLRLSLPVVMIQSGNLMLIRHILIGALLAILCAALIAYSISKQFTGLVKDIHRMAVAFSKEEFQHQLPKTRSKEMTKLVQSMVSMANLLHDRVQSVSKEKSEKESILANMVEAVLTLDMDQNITLMNSAACSMFNINEQDVIGKPISECIDNKSFLDFILDTSKKEDVNEHEIEMSGDPLKVVLSHGVCLYEHTEKMGILIVCQDITRIKQLEHTRRDFVANVSHELKTPITLIKGAVETLIQGAVHDEENRDQFLSIILRHSDRLAAIIDDLLRLSKIEGNLDQFILDCEHQNIFDMVQGVVENCSQNAEKKTITLNADSGDPVMMTFNRRLLEQALGNLVDNAIKYSPEDSVVSIIVQKEGDDLWVSVQDEGPGIPKEHIPKLFQRFYRVDKARSRDMGGTGLGLSIVKHIVKAHGGSVGVKSEEENGACFWMCLPIRDEIVAQPLLFEPC